MEPVKDISELIEYYEDMGLRDEDIDMCLFWVAGGFQIVINTKENPPTIKVRHDYKDNEEQ